MNWILIACGAGLIVCWGLSFIALYLDFRPLLNRVLAVASFFAGMYLLFMGLAIGASEQATFMFFIRMATTANLLIRLSCIVLFVVFARLTPVLCAIFVVPVSLINGALIFQNWTGILFVDGFDPGPFGNVGRLAEQTFWFQLNNGANLWGLITFPIILWLAWRGNTSRRYRKLVIQILLAGICSNALALLSTVLWLQYKFPDTTAFSGLAPVFVYLNMILRYRHLSEQKPVFASTLLEIDKSIIILADVQGRLVGASERAYGLFDIPRIDIQSHRVFDLFIDSPRFKPYWEDVLKGIESWGIAKLVLRGEEYGIRLIPHYNEFKELEGVIVHVEAKDSLHDLEYMYGISTREKELAILVLDGFDNEQIAQELCISPATVKNHLHNLYQKTNTAGRSDFIRLLLSK